MPSLLVSMTVPQSQEEQWVDILCECGSTGVEVQNFESPWVTLKSFFPIVPGETAPAILAALEARIPEDHHEITAQIVSDQDWLKSWREALRPFPVGGKFFIVPGDREARVPENRNAIFLEPGMAFGTGTHESTQLCLQMMEGLDLADAGVLDVGTGSGILSIAAALRGAQRIFACDIDPTATETASENFRKNRVQERINLWTGSLDAVQPRSVDVCFANLMLSLFEKWWPEFRRVLKAGGHLICSGILAEQSQSFHAQLNTQGLQALDTRVMNEWIGVLAQRADS
jgi:ribosomal protein L11 methyltransferase